MTARPPPCCAFSVAASTSARPVSGAGIAIPHCRTLVSNRLRVAFARHPAGVEWDAIDRRPVHYLFLIVAPPLEVSNQYLPVLGRIAQFAKDADIPERLAALTSPADFFALLESRGRLSRIIHRGARR